MPRPSYEVRLQRSCRPCARGASSPPGPGETSCCPHVKEERPTSPGSTGRWVNESNDPLPWRRLQRTGSRAYFDETLGARRRTRNPGLRRVAEVSRTSSAAAFRRATAGGVDGRYSTRAAIVLEVRVPVMDDPLRTPAAAPRSSLPAGRADRSLPAPRARCSPTAGRRVGRVPRAHERS